MVAPKNNIEEGKPCPSLIPMDLLIPLMCPTYEEGVEKYAKDSWRQGFLMSTCYDSLMRHLTAFYFGRELIDQDSLKQGVTKQHLGAVIFWAVAMYDGITNHPEYDDRLDMDKINVKK